ncbi:MAG TPA: hypothetical protein VHX68_14075 [Planctomycetaceae bacterium]|jgi:hypothetical protein|nr:hypothetical protein [Planctomycetaceae bacterium]
MNVRLFLLIGMTAFFAVLWSSDQQYQEVQMAAARTARQRLAELPAPTVAEGAGLIDRPPSAPTSPFAVSSWVAPTIATPLIVESPHQPHVPPVDVQANSPAKTTPGSIVSMIVSFQRPSFRFDAGPLESDVKVADGADGAPQGVNAELAGLVQWAGRVRFEVDGQTCQLRWQMRRTAMMARRRFLLQLARQSEWGELAGKILLGALGQADAPAKNAAAAPVGEAR